MKSVLHFLSALSALLGRTELSLAAVSGSPSTGQGRTLLCVGPRSTSALVGIFYHKNYRSHCLRERLRWFFFLSISSFVYEKMPSLRTKISQNWWKVSLVLCPPHSKSLTSFKYVTLTIQSGLFSQKIVYVCLDRYSLTLVSLQLFCLWADVMYYYWKIVRFIKHQKSCVEWLFSGLKSFH